MRPNTLRTSLMLCLAAAVHTAPVGESSQTGLTQPVSSVHQGALESKQLHITVGDGTVDVPVMLAWRMKCLAREALEHWGGVEDAKVVEIEITNRIVKKGTASFPTEFKLEGDIEECPKGNPCIGKIENDAAPAQGSIKSSVTSKKTYDSKKSGQLGASSVGKVA
ncbi:hypothetical protein F5890DRAFT_652632 [Lentinula detonsa]|uniref:Uncharacterized protein n=1 Tax=Lentinula detonsa TaxID=2804962 RepID=A0AA38UQX2_9AGAR|nr:hypothetical protein F5890DRAFT_652632 [Lentinula detonsa]